MKQNRIFYTLLFFVCSLPIYAQDCTEEALSKKTGSWKAGLAGSTPNVTAVELTKEKATLAKIHAMMTAAYKPVGAQAFYANSFSGPDQYSGKNWVAGHFNYSIYVLRFFCDKNSADKSKFTINPSTATTFNIWANALQQLNTLWAADMPDDEFRGYLKLERMPVKKDGFYFMGEKVVGDSHLPKQIKEYRWLITYGDTLPFYYVSRKDYLVRTKKRLEKTIQENGNSSGYYTTFMNKINDWLAKSDAELSVPAICMWNDEERFNGFVAEGTNGSFIAVRPNMAYYKKKFPRSTPQFFSVVFKVAESSEVEVSNMNDIRKAVDFTVLRNMLGK
jgi:uncharacterized protein YozE (UPF0346 family)